MYKNIKYVNKNIKIIYQCVLTYFNSILACQNVLIIDIMYCFVFYKALFKIVPLIIFYACVLIKMK